jgi:phytoene dehydrogenase-like protein
MSKLVIVGGGIAGLSAGVYALKSGFEVALYESHVITGGNCTGWQRGKYFFEGGMQWLTGSADHLALNKVWRETGAITDATRISNIDPFVVVDYHGQKACLYRDLSRLESHLISISPEDTPRIKQLCKDIKRFRAMNMPVTDIPGVRVARKAPSLILAGIPMLGALSRVFSLSRISTSDYASKFHNPAIRLLLQCVVDPEFDALSLFFILGCIAGGDGGIVEGGASHIVQGMTKRFTDLGGMLCCNRRVDTVVVKDGKAAGIVIAGEVIPADAVLVATDTLSAVDTLFSPPLSESWVKRMRKRARLLITSFVSLGIEADLSDLPRTFAFALDAPFEQNGHTTTRLIVHNYAGNAQYAPDGCSTIAVLLDADYDYWKNARADGVYTQRKKELYEALLARLEAQIPAIKGKVAQWDVATPLTFERYCGTYHGSWMTKNIPGHKILSYPRRPKSIRRLYFAGQRILSPGGLPVAVNTGRTAVQYLCRDFGAVFGGATR